MKDFSRGVSYYTKGHIEIDFPEDDARCWWCPLMRVELKTERCYCGKTGEYLVAPRFIIGSLCPVQFDEEKENT